MTDDAFQDKVQSEFEQVYQQKRSGSPAWTFFSHADDKNGKNVEYKKDTESKALYLQGETPKAKDIVDGPKDGAKTEVNAKGSRSKRFMMFLTVIVRCQILSRQDMPKSR